MSRKRLFGLSIAWLWYWLMLIFMGLCIGHSTSWIICVLLGFGARIIMDIYSSTSVHNYGFDIRLGNPQPAQMDYQNGLIRETDCSVSPSDEVDLFSNEIFSTTITVYTDLCRESVAVEDMEFYTMDILLVRDVTTVLNQTNNTIEEEDEEESNDTSDGFSVQRPSEVPLMENSQAAVERQTHDNIDNENEWYRIYDCPIRFQMRMIGHNEDVADGSVTDGIVTNTVLNPTSTHHEGLSQEILFLAEATEREIQRNVPESDGDETLQPIVNPPSDTRPKQSPTTGLHETHAL
ncbi:unnamed protein product [Adineta ricciae]|uniref:Uncharacterized protein n=1 Tax=Adineta ricciae TaxID=249248 RepID=A0A815FQF4_ADIRI|nr:unnamed protein product [Adineta ricciae]